MPNETEKKLTPRQRGILRKLTKCNGQRAGFLGVGSQSGNVLEHLLHHDLVRIDVTPVATRVFITAKGRTALSFGSVVVEG